MAVWTLFALGSTLAQEPEDSEEQEQPAESEDAAQEPPDPSVDDVFIPSERISADQEVTFPVDI